ncbi:MAG: hypothetical protein AAGA60_28110 [Cyanobacteria bacterium P01_E01_bin.42]
MELNIPLSSKWGRYANNNSTLQALKNDRYVFDKITIATVYLGREAIAFIPVRSAIIL